MTYLHSVNFTKYSNVVHHDTASDRIWHTFIQLHLSTMYHMTCLHTASFINHASQDMLYTASFISQASHDMPSHSFIHQPCVTRHTFIQLQSAQLHWNILNSINDPQLVVKKASFFHLTPHLKLQK